MSSISGLPRDKRLAARQRAVNAAQLALAHRTNVHYTQGPGRWSAINQKLSNKQGQYPRYADCSSFATWCLWNALFLGNRTKDFVNGAAWKAGYTGTMLNHGKPVRLLKNVRKGDLVIYGKRGSVGAHVSIVVAIKNGIPMVISHGSEGGPYYLPYNYRKDVLSIRRYI